MLLRDPHEVPAAIAIALADFCRRAGRPASADEVRVALARLSPDEDRAVEAMCRKEPPAKPLSPHAAIDVLRGLPAAEAARREEAGEYEKVHASFASQTPAVEEAEPAAEPPLASASEPLDPQREEEELAPEEGSDFEPSENDQRRRILETVEATAGDLGRAADALGLKNDVALRRLAAKLGILEQVIARLPTTPKPTRVRKKAGAIAPARRTREEVEARKAAAEARPTEPEEEAPPPPRPGRNPAAPQLGRFVLSGAAKRPWRELESPSGAEALEGLVSELRANRNAIVDRLGTLWARDDGRPIDEGDLRRLLRRHGLTGWFADVERQNLRTLLRQHRGYLPPVARALGRSAEELDEMLEHYNLLDDIPELKERTVEEARQPERALPERILLASEKADQLRDAGVLEELDARNRKELLAVLEETVETTRSRDPGVVVELARRRMAMDPRPFRKGVKRYGLIAEAARLLGVELPEEEEEARPRAPQRREGGVGERVPRPGFLPRPARREGFGLRPPRPGGFMPRDQEAPPPEAADEKASAPSDQRREGFRPREGFAPRPPRREGFAPRGPREGFRPGEGFAPRPPRREGFAPRGPREKFRPRGAGTEGFAPRPPRREGFGPRGPRPEPFGDRPPRREGFGPRGPRPEGFRPRGPRPETFGDRPPRREGFGPRGPRPEGFRPRGPRPETFGDRPPRREGFGPRGPRPEGFRPRGREDEAADTRPPRREGFRPRGPRPEGSGRPPRREGGSGAPPSRRPPPRRTGPGRPPGKKGR